LKEIESNNKDEKRLTLCMNIEKEKGGEHLLADSFPVPASTTALRHSSL
jgi:hypothetical protein